MVERVRLPGQEAEDRRTRQPEAANLASIVEDDAGEEEDKEDDEGDSLLGRLRDKSGKSQT